MINTELIERLRRGQTYDSTNGDLQDMTYLMDEAADALEAVQTASEPRLCCGEYTNLTAALESVRIGELSPTAPCDAVFNTWTDEQRNKLVAAMGKTYPKAAAPKRPPNKPLKTPMTAEQAENLFRKVFPRVSMLAERARDQFDFSKECLDAVSALGDFKAAIRAVEAHHKIGK